MDRNHEMEVYYMNRGFPYTVTENFMDFFGGLSQPPSHYRHPPPMPHDPESASWRFGLFGPEHISYYGPYEVNDQLMRMDYNRRAWEYPSVMNIEEPATVDMPSEEIQAPSMQAIPEERTLSQQDGASSPVVWEDNIDPDNMTYEELIDLGEAVGTQSRGLSQELINLLPISKYKSGGIFSRKRSSERCVICQMKYKRGDRQIHLPCKHVYHADCGSKWLSINKTCPVCNSEVCSDESRQ